MDLFDSAEEATRILATHRLGATADAAECGNRLARLYANMSRNQVSFAAQSLAHSQMKWKKARSRHVQHFARDCSAVPPPKHSATRSRGVWLVLTRAASHKQYRPASS